MPLHQAVTAYARHLVQDCGADASKPLLALALEADFFTAPHIARLLLIGNDRNADPPYRYGGQYYDSWLQELAGQVGYTG